MHRIGIMDIGTQSVLFLLAEKSGGRLYRLVESSANVRLGDVGENGAIREERLDTCSRILLDFADQAESAGSERILAVGTDVFRTAPNGREAADRLADKTGIPVEILSASEEAALSFRGAMWKRDDSGPCWVVDIGGGSTECILGSDGRMVQWNSLPLGAVRMHRLLRGDPPEETSMEEMRKRIRELFDSCGELGPGKADTLIGIGGTVTTLGAMELGLDEYNPDRVNGLVLPESALREWMRFFLNNPVRKRAEISGLSQERADIILPGTAIVLHVLERVGLDRLVISDRGLRHGVLIREAEKLD